MNGINGISILSMAGVLAVGLQPAQAESMGSSSATLEEVIVTAQKREERLLDVPISLSAIDAQTLVDANQLKIQDYYTQIPGLSMTPGQFSSQLIVIRGITTGSSAANPTVGIMVDDVPFGSTTSAQGANVVPDIDPNDLARLEVLRGPQGTLYGASSMGGLLKYVTVDPSTQALTGRVEAGTSVVHNGAELGYSFRGSINVPISDAFAVRASVFTREDPGFIDNPGLKREGVNESRATGGRVSALWRPSDTLSLKLSALYQKITGDGLDLVNPTAGDLNQTFIRGTGGYDRKIQVYSAILNYKVGAFDLTSVSGFNVNSFHDSTDLTSLLGAFTQDGFGTQPGFGVMGTPLLNEGRTSKFTQEVRLAAPIGDKFDLLLGGFYTYEYSPWSQRFLASDSVSGAVVGQLLYSPWKTTYREFAEFADLTYHVTDRLDVQFGGRESQLRQTYGITYTGPFTPLFSGQSSPYVQPKQFAKSDVFTYLLTPRFKISPDLMVYARVASGYRPGGPNTVTPGIPPQYEPDKTTDYELGAKADFIEHTLSLDASLYYIKWKDIQLSLVDLQHFTIYTGNAGQAKSQGLELSVEANPLAGLTVSSWIAFNDAKLTEPFPLAATLNGTEGRSGDRLPIASRVSANFSLNQKFNITNEVTGYAGTSVSYVGDRYDQFTSAGLRQHLPSYVKTDLRAGLDYNSYTVQLYVNNLADRRAPLSVSQGLPPGTYFIQPRIAGISLAKSF